jgi:hypothetical protein
MKEQAPIESHSHGALNLNKSLDAMKLLKDNPHNISYDYLSMNHSIFELQDTENEINQIIKLILNY